jgi:hypothetical protein
MGSETTIRTAIHKIRKCLCSPRGCEIYSIIAALMTKPVFNIAASSIDGDTIGSSLLLMEVNETSFTYIIVDETQKLLAAAYFVLPQVDGRHVADSIRDIIDAHGILQHDYKQAVVVYNFSESSLVPDSMYRNEMNRDLADLLFGNLRKGLVLSEKIDHHDLHTIYRIPAPVHAIMQQKFSAGKYWHIYTLWLSAIEKSISAEGEDLFLVFAADKVLTAAFQKGKLLLMRSFAYSTPEDVVYHLLHCCDQLSISQDECLLHISGYIDEDSALYNEIRKYFLRLEFDTVDGVAGSTSSAEKLEFKDGQLAEEIDDRETAISSDYPPHYFSYLQKLALCV